MRENSVTKDRSIFFLITQVPHTVQSQEFRNKPRVTGKFLDGHFVYHCIFLMLVSFRFGCKLLNYLRDRTV